MSGNFHWRHLIFAVSSLDAICISLTISHTHTLSIYIFWFLRSRPFLTHTHPNTSLHPHTQPHPPASAPDLLDEAKERCRAELVERKSDLTPEELDATAEALGYGAVKYFDLSKNRITNYQFAYDAMCDLKGNTGAWSPSMIDGD